MSNLVVVAFDGSHKVAEVHLKLEKLQSEYLLDLADMVVAASLVFLNAATGVAR
jgi:uncharacterized membrane protein